MKLNLLHLVNFIIILLIIIIIDDADDRTIQSIESITTSNTESREDSSITTHTQSSASVSSIPDDIAMDKNCIPVQPHGKFPSKQYGSVNRSFQSSWYIDYPWLEYSVSKNCAYCFPCRFFSVNGDKTFIYTGYSNWKCARGKEGGLQVHHMSSKHKDATLSWRQYQSTVANDSTIINHLEAGRLKKIQDNRQYVMYLLEVILCCSQQGLALRGHREVQDAEEAINVVNFRSFVRLHSCHIPLLQERLQSIVQKTPHF